MIILEGAYYRWDAPEALYFTAIRPPASFDVVVDTTADTVREFWSRVQGIVIAPGVNPYLIGVAIAVVLLAVAAAATWLSPQGGRHWWIRRPPCARSSKSAWTEVAQAPGYRMAARPLAADHQALGARDPRRNHMTADEFRRMALNLPDVVEASHMGHPDFRVGGKIFATLGYPSAGFGVVVLSPQDQDLIVRDYPKAFAPAPGKWGAAGSTTIPKPLSPKYTTVLAMLCAGIRSADATSRAVYAGE